MTFAYLDIHSHLNDKRYENDLPEVLTRMREAGVASIVVGTDREMSERAIALAEKHEDLWATIGQHPTDKHDEVFDYTIYRTMASSSRVVAIGECGLDYYWPEVRNRQRSDLGISATSDLDKEKKRQHDLFLQQIALAEEIKKPMMIHGRPTPKTFDAYEDILSLLKGRNVTGNIHFFVGNVDIAKQFLDLGFTVSFTGVLTFTHDYDEVVKYIPLDCIMAETDAPYVAPAPHRGKRNESAFVVETVKTIVRIRGEDECVVQETLVKNAEKTFKLRA